MVGQLLSLEILNAADDQVDTLPASLANLLKLTGLKLSTKFLSTNKLLRIPMAI